MATYNGERFLEEQLRGLGEQTTLPDELVVCDDTSTDRTPQILAQFAKRARFPVKLFTNDERLGWRKNFLKAASLCTSEYIAFCDQDDVWLKEKLAFVELYLRRNPCTLLQHGFRLINEQGKIISDDMDWENLERYEAPWRHSYGLTQVFHRSLLDFSDLWELSEDHFERGQRMGHDHWIRFLSSLLGQTLSIKEVLLLYRQHPNSVVGWWSPADKPKRDLIGLARTFSDKDYKKKKREELIAYMELMVAAASARGAISQQVATRVGAEKAPQILSKIQFYSDFTQYHTARLSTYQSPHRGQRLSSALHALRSGRAAARAKRRVRNAVVDLLYGVMG